jgi:uncharacterized protein
MSMGFGWRRPRNDGGAYVLTTLLRLAAIGLGVYAGILLLLYTQQRRLMYPLSDRQATAAEAGLAGFADLTLKTPDGETLIAWFKAPDPGRVTTLFLHGNAGSLWTRRERARILADGGRGVLMLAYRGYAGSTGRPSEEGLTTDARTAYDWLTARVSPDRLVLYGESLGTGVALSLAVNRPVAGVILDAPYTSTADVARLTYWWAPVDWLMLDQYRSMDIVSRLKAPLLVLHGTRDGIIPFTMGERLFQAAPEPKRFVRIEGGDHVRNLETPVGLEAVRQFLGEIEERPR